MPCGFELAVQRLGEADHGELRGAVDAEPLHADESGHRGGVDDVAAVRLARQQRHEGLDAVHDAPEVDVHRVLPVAHASRWRSRRRVAMPALLQTMWTRAEALALPRRRARATLSSAVTSVGTLQHLGRPRSVRPRPLERRRVEVGEHDARAARGEGARHGHADAAATAGDDRDPILEIVHDRDA